MLGKKISKIYPYPKKLIASLMGHIDINIRQKWTLLWPLFNKINNAPIDVLDAGCGNGEWALELRKRLPNWTIDGVDFDEKQINKAKQDGVTLNISKCTFEAQDFLNYTPNKQYDLIYSIAAFHYLMEVGKQDELFTKVKSWLKPDGKLIAFIPRCKTEVPDIGGNYALPVHDVASYNNITDFCTKHNFEIEYLQPCINKNATLAKQIYATSGGIKKLIKLPKMFSLSSKKNLVMDDINTPSYAWILIAKNKC